MPIIFNLIIDAVLRTWKGSGGWQKSWACFYADDGLIKRTESERLQTDLNIMIELFKRVGLATNEIKTKFMVVRGAAVPQALSTNVYNQMC